VADFSHLDEPRHGADGLFDRGVGVNPVLVVEIDHLDAEPLQALVRALAHVFRPARHAAHRRIGGPHDAELGGNDDRGATTRDRASDEFLVMTHAVHVGGVQEGTAKIDRAVDRRDRFPLIRRAIELRHAHAAEAEGGDVEYS